MQYTPPGPGNPFHVITEHGQDFSACLKFRIEFGELVIRIHKNSHQVTFTIPRVMIGILEQCISPDSENLRLLRRSLGDLMKTTLVLQDGKPLEWSQVIAAGDLEGFDPNELDNQDKTG